MTIKCAVVQILLSNSQPKVRFALIYCVSLHVQFIAVSLFAAYVKKPDHCTKNLSKMSSCGVCNKNVSKKSPGLQCSGSCETFFHAKCVQLRKNELARFALPGSFWKCPDCRKDLDSSTLVIFDESEPLETEQSEDIMSILRALQNDSTHLRSLPDKYNDLLESVKFCSDQITTFETTLKEVNKKVSLIDKLTNENMTLKNEVKLLDTRIDQLEQYSRSYNVEIQGVPEKENENVYTIVQTIGQSLNCPVEITDIDIAHRVARAAADGTRLPKSIIVRFVTRRKRDALIAAARTAKTAAKTKNLKIDGISNQLYINEHLTKKNKQLLKRTKEVAKSKNFQFVWVRYGRIFMRRDDKSQMLVIQSEADLQKLN